MALAAIAWRVSNLAKIEKSAIDICWFVGSSESDKPIPWSDGGASAERQRKMVLTFTGSEPDGVEP